MVEDTNWVTGYKKIVTSGQFDEHSHGFLDSTEDMIMREMQIKVQLKIYVVIASHIVTKKHV